MRGGVCGADFRHAHLEIDVQEVRDGEGGSGPRVRWPRGHADRRDRAAAARARARCSSASVPPASTSSTPISGPAPTSRRACLSCPAARARARSRRSAEGVKDFEGGRPRGVRRLARLLCRRQRIVPADRLVKLSKSISYETAAAMMLKGLTAQYLLRQTYKVARRRHDPRPCGRRRRRADPVPMGQGARRDRDRHRRHAREGGKLAKKAGANHVILYRDENFVERVRDDHQGQAVRCRLRRRRQDHVSRLARLHPAARDVCELWLVVGQGRRVRHRPPRSKKARCSRRAPRFSTTRPTPPTCARCREDLMRDRGERLLSASRSTPPRPLEDAVAVHRALEARETTGSTVLTL